MSPKENIEEFIKARKPVVTTSNEMDKRTLENSLATMEQTMCTKSPGTTQIVTLNRAIKFTTAAVVIIVLGLFLCRDKYTPKEPVVKDQADSQSPAKITSIMSLRMAYQRGGIDALDKQLQTTLELLGPQSVSISRHELLNGTNGI